MAVSVKRPHWIMLGPRGSLMRPGVRAHTVLGTNLVSYVDHRANELRIVRDHDATTPGDMMSTPSRYYEYAVLQNVVWLDYAKGLCTQHFMPPTVAELSKKTHVVDSYAYAARDNAVAVVEKTLCSVRYVAHEPLRSTVDMGVGRATRCLELPGCTVAVWFEVPFTVCVRFTLDDGATAAVMFSVQPQHRGQVVVHVQIGRPREWNARLIRLVDAVRCGSRCGGVDDGDPLVERYREEMSWCFPEVVREFVHI